MITHIDHVDRKGGGSRSSQRVEQCHDEPETKKMIPIDPIFPTFFTLSATPISKHAECSTVHLKLPLLVV